MAASVAGNPQARKASAMKEWIATAGTRGRVSALLIRSGFFLSG
jgi:hypothetical protein